MVHFLWNVKQINWCKRFGTKIPYWNAKFVLRNSISDIQSYIKKHAGLFYSVLTREDPLINGIFQTMMEPKKQHFAPRQTSLDYTKIEK